ncbi:monovalent cation:proton antiporter-2 (CPA2) family protein [Martelella endophytica]|uniref:Potassium transporter TrkA n=1 Tax=Martelella endophytica TaxID=1486262 RepID=A0A0D5LU02_MAREN|nr:monovalent cation:proton antiporter-2 (CPA2) family protein [Martelella endophytica]AJY47704.1 potassium transporter TrkA [Martelella endophytica]
MATTTSLFSETVWMLGAAAVAAPIFKRLGLGTVLGYLAGGIVIGPVLQRITNGEEVLHVAELGIVFLLFMIGLELKPARLWTMRRDIFGLGLAQVLVTGALLVPLAHLALSSWPAALIAGFGLALSSTAFAMQILDDSGDVNTRYGQRSFSMLLFQDIAIVPLLALVSILGGGAEDATAGDMATNAALALAVIAAMIAAGRYVLTPVFQIIAATGAREVMIVAALFLVIGAAMAMQMVGLSMAMGAFLAGVMLAESSYRHELEADIEPFRGVFLSIFFIAVGLSLELQVVYENLLLIAIAVPVLILVKALVIYGLCRLTGSPHADAVRIAALLPQGGEFGFVMFSTAAAAGIFSNATASLLIAIVTVSMVATPLCVRLAERLFVRREAYHEEIEEDFADAGADVLMIGFSRFGQIAAQILLASGREVTIIDFSAERIRQASAFGFHIYFGDGTRKDVLIAAGIEKAKIVAVCTQKREITDRVIDVVQENFPRAHIYARSYDRGHTLALRQRGVEYELRETLESGLVFGRETLIALGSSEEEAMAITDDIRKRDAKRLEIQAVEGIMAGADMLHTHPVSPEPLMRPKRRQPDPTVKVTGKDMA